MVRQGRSFSGLERNCCFLNTLGNSGQERFANISAVSGLDFPDDARALAAVDWNQNGNLDLWVSNRNAPRLRLLINDSPTSHRSVQFRLVGNGSDTNRDAVGARVVLQVQDPDTRQSMQMIKTLRAGEGFLSQSSPWLHFGLAQRMEVSGLRVRWPNREGTEEEFDPVAPGRYELRQGSAKALAVPPRPAAVAVKESPPQLPPPVRQHRIPLVHQLPAPDLGYFDFAGTPQPFQHQPGQSILVNLWSSTCQPCREELREFIARAEELKQAGIQVLALSVDELETGDPDSRQQAQATAQRLQPPFQIGMAPPRIVQQLRELHNIMIKLERPLPLPTSFLIDSEGRLDVIYKGKVAVDTLLADAAPPADHSLLGRFRRSSSFSGLALEHPRILASMMQDRAWAHAKLALALEGRGEVEKAIAQYRKVVDAAPDSATMHNNLATQLQLAGQTAQALDHYQIAARLDPKNNEVQINLALALMVENQLAEAKTRLDAVVGREPNNANALFALGVWHTRSRDLAAARASYQQAVTSDPSHARAQYALGLLWEKDGEVERALACYLAALRSLPREFTVRTSLAALYLQQGKLEDAERHLRLAIEHQPRYAESHYQMGRVWAAMNREADARRAWETALALDSNHQAARMALQQQSRGGQVMLTPGR